ncbi:MAG: class I SAM-dependent methyltransferase [Asticcacaulis sp.]
MKLPGWMHNLIHNRTETESIALRPDRQVLTGTLLSALAHFRSVLWIGCQPYTLPYYDALESHGGQCSTLDLDPASAIWGREGRHVTGDLTRADELFEAGSLQAVICNGIFGWGVNSEDQRQRAFTAMARILEPDGVLLLGWNNHKTPDPLELASRWFAPHVLNDVPSRIVVERSTHRYDLLQRLP